MNECVGDSAFEEQREKEECGFFEHDMNECKKEKNTPAQEN